MARWEDAERLVDGRKAVIGGCPNMRWWTVAMLSAAQACVPSSGIHALKVKSSGKVGCAPEEIKIYDARDDGSTRTWVAHCHGATYYCSWATMVGYAPALVPSIDQDVSCAKRNDEEEVYVTRTSPDPKPAPEPLEQQHVTKALPTAALGYDFGASLTSAMESCTNAQHTWTPLDEQFHCSGTPEHIGISIETYLRFCADKLCDLTGIVLFDPANEGSNTQFQQIVDGLRTRYGKPTTNRVTLPGSCKPRFIQCVAEGRASWQAEWKWATGERIVARVDPKESSVRLALRYVMGSPGSVDTSAF